MRIHRLCSYAYLPFLYDTKLNSQITSAADVFALEIQSGQKQQILASVFIHVSAIENQ